MARAERANARKKEEEVCDVPVKACRRGSSPAGGIYFWTEEDSLSLDLMQG